MIRVLHVIENLTPFGGVQNKLAYLAARGNRDRIEHVILAYNDCENSLAQKIRRQGTPVLTHRIASPWSLRLPLQLGKCIRSSEINLVVCHSARSDFFGTVVGRMCGIPVVQYIHGPFYNESHLARLLNKAVSNLRCVTVVNSKATGAFAHCLGTVNPQRVILNGWPNTPVVLSMADRRVLRSDLGIPDTALVIGNVGRMVPIRRQAILPELVRCLRNQFMIDAHLLIVGGGPEYDTVRDRAESLGVANCVKLVGAREDVRVLLNVVDVYINPTIGEGFGNAVVEAMQHGIPVVLAKAGAHTELVVDGVTGFLIPPDDVQFYCRVINALAKNAELRETIGEAGRAHAAKAFDVDCFVASIESLFECLARSRVHVP